MQTRAEDFPKIARRTRIYELPQTSNIPEIPEDPLKYRVSSLFQGKKKPVEAEFINFYGS